MNAIKLITNDNDVPKRSGFTLIMMVRIAVRLDPKLTLTNLTVVGPRGSVI